MNSRNLPDSVAVDAPARLHLGFVDMHGGFGRRFGSIGLSISGVATRLAATRAERSHAEGPGSERALQSAAAVLGRLGLSEGVSLRVQQAIPEHAGLGSGTQMALAVGAAVNRLYGRMLQPAELATLTGRGLRSGIGISAFSQGGFIVDGGRGEHTVVPPVIARLPFPERWRLLLIQDHAHQGVHGRSEVEAFAGLRQMDGLAGELCRRVLVQMLPALAEEDFDGFADAVAVLQDAMGQMFSDAQGGRYASPRVAEVLDNLRARGVRGCGQSSWGPTGFALFSDDATAQAALIEARIQYRESALEFLVVRGINQGATVEDAAAVRGPGMRARFAATE